MYSYGLRAGRPGLDFWQGQDFLCSTASRPALGPTQPPIQWVLWTHSPPGREPDYLPSSSAEVKNGLICLHFIVPNWLSTGKTFAFTKSVIFGAIKPN
jgi:hypothetical protein